MTWGQLKDRVARVAGSSGDADQLAVAGYAIEMALQHWESLREWKYSVTSTTFNVTAGTSTYALPSDFRSVYNLRFRDNSPRVLFYQYKRDYDFNRPNQVGTATPIAYTLVDEGGLGQVELLPANSLTDVMVMYYYRRHTVPAAITAGTTSADSTVVDFPSKYMHALIALAKTFYLADKGGEEQRMSFWGSTAKMACVEAMKDDDFKADDMPSFTPAPAPPLALGPNDIRPYLAEW